MTDKKAKTLLYLGRLHPKKGLIQLIKAWAIFRQLNPQTQWNLAIAGWDQEGHEVELQKLATQLGIPWISIAGKSDPETFEATGIIQFLGPKFGSEKDYAFRNMDAFILPSLSEGQPMVVLEAWAYSKPVIMTAMCNLPEGFSASAAFQIGTEQSEIANCIAHITQLPPHKLKEAGMEGRRLVESKFTWSRVAAMHHDLHEWLLQGGPIPQHVQL